MCNLNGLARNSVMAQERMFRLAERDYGLSVKALHLESGIPVNTLSGWKNGTTMPAWALGALGKAGVPDYLLSLVLNPFSRHVGTDDDGDGALDCLGRETAGFTSDYLEAKSPDSEGGDKITPREAARLAERAMKVACRARAVAR